ncbi:MAG: CPBP family intramembrane metalloprotease [Erysipelotrichaceae bacterium]|nr:CPBP family intramembrane metalloprotease [Erysipelotrichaceae bacterium]
MKKAGVFWFGTIWTVLYIFHLPISSVPFSVGTVDTGVLAFVINTLFLWVTGVFLCKKRFPSLVFYRNQPKEPIRPYLPSVLAAAGLPLGTLYIYLRPLDAAPGMLNLLIEGVGYALAVGFFEEWVFRGLFQQSLRKRMRPFDALCLGALAFSLGHVPAMIGLPAAMILMRVCWTLALGFYFGALYEKTRNLSFVSVVHALVDGSVILFLFSSQNTYPFRAASILLCIFYALGAYGLYLLKEESS